MTYEIVVSIINYRTGDLTLSCMRSVLADMKGRNGLIVVVDNQSADGSAEQISEWIATQPKDTPVRFIQSPTNAGFSGGHNQGISAAEADFYLVLNSDAILRPGFLDNMLGATIGAPDHIGLFAPVIEYEDGGIQDSCFRFPGPFGELVRSARSSVVTRIFKKHEVSLGPSPKPEDIGWASFACILLRGSMIQQIGPMDEGYFLYYEDAEYCLRARRVGWRIQQVPEARVLHFRGGSGPVKTLHAQRARLPAYYYRSRSRFLFQAHGRVGLLAANLLWYIGRVIKHLTRLIGRKIKPMAREEWKDIWINFRHPNAPTSAPKSGK